MNRKVDVSENISWIFQKGSWCMHMVLTVVIKLTMYQLLSDNVSWQITLIAYNIITFYFFHWKVGDPFDRDYSNYTFWEQIVEQSEDTFHVRFLAIYPAILFIIVNKIVVWNTAIFCTYFITLMMVVIPKLNFMHLKRICGYRSYN